MPEDFRRLNLQLSTAVDPSDGKRLKWIDKKCTRYGRWAALVRKMIDVCMELEKRGEFQFLGGTNE